MSRGHRPIIALLSASALFAGSAVAVAHQPVARSASGCNLGASQGLGLYGYTYLTSLTVRGTNCTTGKNVAKHHGKVSGWHCSKKRLQTSSIQYVDRETCTSGSRHVVWTFTQNG
jgi:hypothetical protein